MRGNYPEPLDERAEMRLNIVLVQHSRQYKRLTIYRVNIGCFVTFDYREFEQVHHRSISHYKADHSHPTALFHAPQPCPSAKTTCYWNRTSLSTSFLCLSDTLPPRMVKRKRPRTEFVMEYFTFPFVYIYIITKILIIFK